MTAATKVGETSKNQSFPKLIVLDLDYTVWPFWCDTHITPPIKPAYDGENIVLDAAGDKFGLYKDIPKIFKEIRSKENVELCAASRTNNPRIAQRLLSMLKVDEEPLSSYFEYTAWGGGSKVRHFQELHHYTGVEYSDMLFFDDELRNKDVEKSLGVCFIEVPAGLNYRTFHLGVDEWRRRNRTQQR